MVNIINGCEVQCIKCGNKMEIDADSFDFDSSIVEDRKNGMGIELEYSFSARKICLNRDEEIEVCFSVFEYPIGDIECVVVNLCSGCKITRMPEFEANPM